MWLLLNWRGPLFFSFQTNNGATSFWVGETGNGSFSQWNNCCRFPSPRNVFNTGKKKNLFPCVYELSASLFPVRTSPFLPPSLPCPRRLNKSITFVCLYTQRDTHAWRRWWLPRLTSIFRLEPKMLGNAMTNVCGFTSLREEENINIKNLLFFIFEGRKKSRKKKMKIYTLYIRRKAFGCYFHVRLVAVAHWRGRMCVINTWWSTAAGATATRWKKLESNVYLFLSFFCKKKKTGRGVI